ncbi:MAG: hypothetical protein LC102_00450 [Ignavibacteriales bacterium]|nr:hypothetical protein [Ignavibacteriaceae bacterium]MCZ2141883.1 hypothetical protein [Ignavibacteriales bacterium]WKZ73848.1 MAG: hypothetical protein QY308_06460 [Ignavibacteriaceae bacterium]
MKFSEIQLYQLPREVKTFLAAFLILLSAAVAIGLVYLYHTTNYTPEIAVKHYNGSQSENVEDDFEIPDSYEKPISELMITTHNHFFGFAFIFFALGAIFWFNSTITGFWKGFLMVEPLISTLFTFGGIWLVRFVHPGFIYLTVVSSSLIYISFAVMAIVALYELTVKK